MARGWISANPCPPNLRSVQAYIPASRDDDELSPPFYAQVVFSPFRGDSSSDDELSPPFYAQVAFSPFGGDSSSDGGPISSVNRLNDAIEETKLPSHAFNERSLRLTFRYLSEGLINPHFLFPRVQTLSL